jgi:cysteine desulfurase/selenocysteine lyase
MVRAGNHCAKILVEVIKTSETVRASVSFYNTKEEVDRLVDALRTITLEQCIDLSIM